MITAKRFKGESIHISGTPEADLKESTLIQILWALEEVDTYLIGEEYCVSNWDCGITVYSYYSDMCYDIIEGYSIEQIEEGKTLILEGRIPTDIDREDIEKEFGTEDTDNIDDISTPMTEDIATA